jgi:hypothetical protein
MGNVEGAPAGFVEMGRGLGSAWFTRDTRDYYRYKCTISDAALV